MNLEGWPIDRTPLRNGWKLLKDDYLGFNALVGGCGWWLPGGLMSTGQVADLRGQTPQAIRLQIAQGRMPARRVLRTPGGTAYCYLIEARHAVARLKRKENLQ